REPGLDGCDPGARSDHRPAAGHSSGGDGHSRTRSAAYAGSHAQRPSPAVPVHTHGPCTSVRPRCPRHDNLIRHPSHNCTSSCCHQHNSGTHSA
ncbi:hypothetical protein M9458_006889, partial [Cirrhinus mrigala]